jgi:hypothetical protein
MQTLKRAPDPPNLMNPRKVLPPEEAAGPIDRFRGTAISARNRFSTNKRKPGSHHPAAPDWPNDFPHSFL